MHNGFWAVHTLFRASRRPTRWFFGRKGRVPASHVGGAVLWPRGQGLPLLTAAGKEVRPPCQLSALPLPAHRDMGHSARAIWVTWPMVGPPYPSYTPPGSNVTGEDSGGSSAPPTRKKGGRCEEVDGNTGDG